MKLSAKQYAQALYDAVTQTDPKDHDKVMDHFVKILAQNGDLEKYEEIESAYKLLDMEAKGIKEVEVTMARDMQPNHLILDELNKIVGSKAELKTKVDDSIVGGVVIRVDDTLIDASVKTQINNLKDSLKE